MNYQEFLDYIKANFANYIADYMNVYNRDMEFECEEEHADDYIVEIHQVVKNNGIILDGLTVRKQDENSSPNLYLNQYFDQYLIGKSLSIIMEELASRYKRAKEECSISIADLTDYEAVKNRIILRLVNYEKNKKTLENCPYLTYMDLAVTFRYMAGKDSIGIASSLITNQEFDLWDVSVAELYEIALSNTAREFPYRLESLVRVVSDYIDKHSFKGLSEEMLEEIEQFDEEENRMSMYVLTNYTGLNGATCILYENVIRDFAKTKEANVYILPSSVHEVMLVPESDESEPDFLQTLVHEANNSSVGLIDLLSDNIYYYDRESDECRICS